MKDGENTSSKEWMKNENEAAMRKFQVIQVINPTFYLRRAFNKKRKKVTTCKMGNLVAIKKTQAGLGLKFHSKLYELYRMVKVLRNERYIVQRKGEHKGPQTTSTLADHMKLWDIVGVSSASDDEHIWDQIYLLEWPSIVSWMIDRQRVWELQWAKRPINVSSVLQSNSYSEKGPTWPWPRTVAEHVRGGAMRKDKGMLKTN